MRNSSPRRALAAMGPAGAGLLIYCCKPRANSERLLIRIFGLPSLLSLPSFHAWDLFWYTNYTQKWGEQARSFNPAGAAALSVKKMRRPKPAVPKLLLQHGNPGRLFSGDCWTGWSRRSWTRSEAPWPGPKGCSKLPKCASGGWGTGSMRR